eukprot:2594450-Pyramimonas_sp.AAC.1
MAVAHGFANHVCDCARLVPPSTITGGINIAAIWPTAAAAGILLAVCAASNSWSIAAATARLSHTTATTIHRDHPHSCPGNQQ